MMVEVADGVTVDVEAVIAVRAVPLTLNFRGDESSSLGRARMDVLFTGANEWVPVIDNGERGAVADAYRTLLAETQWPVGHGVTWDGTAVGATWIIDRVLVLGRHRPDGPVASFDDRDPDNPTLRLTNPNGTEYRVLAGGTVTRVHSEVFAAAIQAGIEQAIANYYEGRD